MELFLGNSLGQRLPLLTVGRAGQITSPFGIGKVVQRVRGFPKLSRRGFICGAAAVSAAAMLPRKAHGALVDDALALYLADQTVGTELTDSTANLNHGTLQGNATWANIGGEQCLDLSTAADSEVDLGDLGFDGNDLSVLFRGRTVTAIPDADIFDQWLTTGDQRSVEIHSKTNGRLTANISEDGFAPTNFFNGVAAGDLVLDTWANFACTFDGDGDTIADYVVYKDDTTNSTDNVTEDGFAFNSTGNLFIGDESVDNNLYLRNIVLLKAIATAQQITDHDAENFGIGGGGATLHRRRRN
jgi:hypothetical protein